MQREVKNRTKTKIDALKQLTKAQYSNPHQLLEVDELEEEMSATSDETPRIANAESSQDSKSRGDNATHYNEDHSIKTQQ